MSNLEKMENDFLELGKESFSEIEDLLLNSGLLIETFIGGESDSIAKLKHGFNRNKVKVFVNYINSKIASFAILVSKGSLTSKTKYDWHIAYLFVEPTHRRMGFGRKIINHIIAFSIKTKADVLTLYTTDDNLPAIEMYRSVGFEESKFITNYICFTIKLSGLRK